MLFEEDKARFLQYIHQEISYSQDENELEDFFKFIDELEDKAQTDKKYFLLVADCYMQMDDTHNAKKAFLNVYNPKDKKDLKKLYNYDALKCKPKVRPSKWAKELPNFEYVGQEILKGMFVLYEDTNCSLCKRKSAAFYHGNAYKHNLKEISLINSEEKICVECIVNGKAAKELDICFNSPFIKEMTVVREEKKEVLLYKTPGCNFDFDYNEHIWQICCKDFCKYIKREGNRFYFKCNICSKEFLWEKET